MLPAQHSASSHTGHAGLHSTDRQFHRTQQLDYARTVAPEEKVPIGQLPLVPVVSKSAYMQNPEPPQIVVKSLKGHRNLVRENHKSNRKMALGAKMNPWPNPENILSDEISTH